MPLSSEELRALPEMDIIGDVRNLFRDGMRVCVLLAAAPCGLAVPMISVGLGLPDKYVQAIVNVLTLSGRIEKRAQDGTGFTSYRLKLETRPQPPFASC